jgi:hypothetical protein
VGCKLNSAVGAGTAVLAFVVVAGFVAGWGALWSWVTGWWTQGWGNLFTVAVALAAIAYSGRSNQQTLKVARDNLKLSGEALGHARTNATQSLDLARDQFGLRRREEHNEKIRNEVATLLSAVSEREQLMTALTGKINRLPPQQAATAPEQEATAPEQATTAPEQAPTTPRQINRIAQEINLAISESLGPLGTRVERQALVIRMLTKDSAILDPVKAIQEAIKKQRKEFKKITDAAIRLAKTEEDTQERKTATGQFIWAALGMVFIIGATELALKQNSDVLIEHCVNTLNADDQPQAEPPQAS